MRDSFELSDSVPRDLWPLVPKNPRDMHALVELLRGELQRGIVGYEEVVARLALLAATHVAQDAMPSPPLSRALIIGGPGTGKTTLGLRLPKALGLPMVYLPAPSLAETNWRGSDAADLVAAMYQEVFRDHSPAETVELAERAIVIIDDIDTLRLPGHYGRSSQTFDYQAGRQRSLVPVAGDGVLPLEVGSRNVSWPSRRSLVISLGNFEGLEPGRIAPDHLTDWGMIPRLSRALCSGSILRLPSLDPAQTVRLLRQKTARLATTFRLFGYGFSVSDEAIAYIVDHLSTERSDLVISNAMAILEDAVERILLRLIDSAAPEGEHHTLAPDDLDFAAQARGLWRE